jgi:hypothetical protein
MPSWPRTEHFALGISHPSLFRGPGALAGQGQARFFKKANYIEKIGDNERTEEIQEILEVKDDEQNDQSQRDILDGKGLKQSPQKSQMEKQSDYMTRGT